MVWYAFYRGKAAHDMTLMMYLSLQAEEGRVSSSHLGWGGMCSLEIEVDHPVGWHLEYMGHTRRFYTYSTIFFIWHGIHLLEPDGTWALQKGLE